MGVGLLYHLVKEGWTDVMLVEKGELTSGSTWHAAGLVPHFIGSLNMAKVHLYGSKLYASLEAETGQATGWHGCGAIRLALTEDEVLVGNDAGSGIAAVWAPFFPPTSPSTSSPPPTKRQLAPWLRYLLGLPR